MVSERCCVVLLRVHWCVVARRGPLSVTHPHFSPYAEQPSAAERSTVLNAQVDTLGDGAAILTCTRLNQVASDRSVTA